MTKQIKTVFLFVGIVSSCILVGLGLETTPGNAVGWILVFVGLAYCVGASIYLAASKMGNVLNVESSDRSLWLIGPGFLVALTAAPLEYMYLPPLLPRTHAVEFIGLWLIGTGLGLRLWMRWVLGQRYAGPLQGRISQHLVQTGPYRFLRHPGYASLGLMTIGLCVGYSSLIGLLAILALLLPGVAYRIRMEEKLLGERFGDKYRTYVQRTKRLIPGLW
jgi:protein-S-isoprenylcysteine O-methyltransferase Ste14